MTETVPNTLSRVLTNTARFIVPLLNAYINKEMIAESTGFINAYSYDINRPQYDNHVFLVYDHDIQINSKMYRVLKKAGLFSSAYKIKINDLYYIVYAIPIVQNKKEIEMIKSGEMTLLLPSTKQQILTFWSGSPILGNISYYLLFKHDINKIQDNVPESEYFLSYNEYLLKMIEEGWS